MSASLKDKLGEANAKVAELEKSVAGKWSAAESARGAFLESGADPTDNTSDAFKSLDAAYRAHDDEAEALTGAKSAREALVRMVATETGRSSAGGGEKRSTSADELRAAFPELERRGFSIPDLAARVTDSDEYRALKDGGVFDSTGAMGQIRLGKSATRDELKALITSDPSTGVGSFITPDRQGYYPMLTAPPVITDLITVGTTDSNLVQYVKQTLVQHNVGVQAVEGDVKPESRYEFDLADATVRTLAHWIPAAKQALADVGQLRTMIEGLLRQGLAQYVEAQILNGTGAGANLRGILNTTGIAVPSVAGAESGLDRVHHGITSVRLANLVPSAIAFHPLDWEKIRLARDASGASAQTGGYLMGSPVTSGLGVTVWGLTPAITTQIPQGTALVGDFRQAILWLREGVSVLASDSHEDFFIRNLVAILAEMRAAFGVPRPDAFAKVNLGVVA